MSVRRQGSLLGGRVSLGEVNVGSAVQSADRPIDQTQVVRIARPPGKAIFGMFPLTETQEWLESLDAVVDNAGRNRYEGMGLKEAREVLEKELLAKALARNSGNLTKAAQELGVSRPTLYDLMEKFGMPKE